MDPEDRALLQLLARLAADGYHFVTPTPATHARVLARPERREARSLADVLGWSLPAPPGLLAPEIEALLRRAGVLDPAGGRLKSRVRVSSVRDDLFLHSAYPTDAADAVFLGPDSYRFADCIARELAGCRPGARIADIGTGAGVGAITAARACPGAMLVMTDINPVALRLARINARHAGVTAEAIECDGLAGVEGPLDLVLANPPYIADAAGPAYRDGGDMHGGRLSLDLAAAAMARLAPGGRLILYTGSAIVDGQDTLRAALGDAARTLGCAMSYGEIDPDVFGEELALPAYRDVDRIALVTAICRRR